MSQKLKQLLIILICLKSIISYSQYEISGQLKNYDSLWHNQIYLSYIAPNESYGEVHKGQVINYSTLDKFGNFKLVGDNLPKSKSIIRLSLSPITSNKNLAFSNDPKNYVLMIMTNDSKLKITSEDFSLNSSNYVFFGHLSIENNKIRDLQLILDESDRFFKNSKSHNGKAFHLANRYRRIRNFCDTIDSPLVKILALQHLNLEQDYLDFPQYYDILLKEMSLSKKPSDYLSELNKKIDTIKFNHKLKKADDKGILYWIIAILILIILSMIINNVLIRRRLSAYQKTSSINKATDLHVINQLTKREKDILDLLVKDYQNKEIANQLHLETSTIKTHLSKIYQKLNVENRKQAKTLFLSFLKKD